MAGDPLSPAGKAKPLLGGGFDIDLRRCNFQRSSQGLLHCRKMGCQLWRLCDDGHVDIADPKLFRPEQLPNVGKQLLTVDVFVGGIGVGKMPPSAENNRSPRRWP